jgi:hypothetical protein
VRLAVAIPPAIVLAATVGCAYALAVFAFTAVHYRVGATCVAAGALGLLTAVLLRVARVRGRGTALLLAALVWLLGLWASWVAWVYRLHGTSDAAASSPAELAASPLRLVQLIRGVNEVGVWRVGGDTFRGALLWAVWGAEACTLALVCLAVAWRAGGPRDRRLPDGMDDTAA